MIRVTIHDYVLLIAMKMYFLLLLLSATILQFLKKNDLEVCLRIRYLPFVPHPLYFAVILFIVCSLVK